MIDVKRMRAALLALSLAPLAACSSVPNPMDALGNLPGFGGDDNSEVERPDDGRVSILSFEQGLSLAAGETAGPVVLPPAYANPVWPQPGGYPTHAVQHTQASGALDVAWQQNAGAGSDNDRRLNAAPIIADGRVYLIDASGEVRAMDADTGAEIWSTRLEGSGRRDNMAFGGGISFDSGRIYVHSGYNYFVALDATNGSEVWRTETLVPFHGSPTIVDGRVFVSSDDNELLAIEASSGTVLWTYQGIVETARIITSPSPAVLGDIVVAPFASGELVALRVQNGSPVWSDSLTRSGGLNALSEINDVAGSPVIIDNTVYAMSHSGVLVAISLRTGERLWSQPAGGLHTPWVAGDFIFVVTSEAEVVSFNRHTGAVHWIRQLALFEDPEKRKNRIAWSGPVLASGRIFAASSSGEGVVINAYDGEITRTVDLRDGVFIPPVIANETIYVLTDSARLLALR